MNQSMEEILKKILIAGVIGFIVIGLFTIPSLITGDGTIITSFAGALVGAIYAIGWAFGWGFLKAVLATAFGVAQDISIYTMITGRGITGFVILLFALALFVWIGVIVGLGKLIYDVIKALRKPNYTT